MKYSSTQKTGGVKFETFSSLLQSDKPLLVVSSIDSVFGLLREHDYANTFVVCAWLDMVTLQHLGMTRRITVATSPKVLFCQC